MSFMGFFPRQPPGSLPPRPTKVDLGSGKRTWLAQLCLSEIQGYFRTRERLPLGLILYPNLEINQILLFEPGKKKMEEIRQLCLHRG